MSVAMLAVIHWFDDAMQMLPLDLLTQASVQAARAKLLKHDWHFGSYMAWVSFHEMSQAHTFDWSALRIPDPARADRQKNWTCHAPLVPDRSLTPLEHVAHASCLLHPFHHTVRLETDLRFAIDACVHLGI